MTWTTQAWGHDGETYDGKDMRQLVEACFYQAPGVVHGLAVTQQGSPAATVLVAAGKAIVDATGSGLTGKYHAWNDAAISSPTIDPTTTNGRKDRLILRITAGVPALEVVKGTAAASPAEPAITGDNYLELALITLPSSTTNITNAMITDRRVWATAKGGLIPRATASLPATTHPGLAAFDLTDGLIKVRNVADSAWVAQGNYFLGTSAPSPATLGMLWMDTTATPWHLKRYNGSAWVGVTAPVPQTYDDDWNGGATSYTSAITRNSILTAPFPLTMHVMCVGRWGFSTGNPVVNLRILDEGGTLISRADLAQDKLNFAEWIPVSVQATKDYAAGATCGYRLSYKVSSDNVYVYLGTVVTFWPKPS